MFNCRQKEGRNLQTNLGQIATAQIYVFVWFAANHVVRNAADLSMVL